MEIAPIKIYLCYLNYWKSPNP